MHIKRISQYGVLVFVAGILILVGGCVGNRQYRTDYTLTRHDPRSGSEVIEVETNYSLGFVELDDQGWLWNRKQIDAISQQFAEELKTKGLLMVTFVHGWKHNASASDENVKMFRGLLKQLALVEQH